MTEMAYPSFSTEVNHYNRMRAKNGTRDRTMQIIQQVRDGHLRQLFPSELELNLNFEGVPTSNFIDIVAHDMAEGIAPLPSLACVAGKMKSQADLTRAETKNRIGDSFWKHSRLEQQMLKGADRYVSYGFLPFFIEPDVDSKSPFIQLDDPMNAYYEKDRFGRVTVYAKRWLRTVDELASAFPEWESTIRAEKDGSGKAPGDQQIELVRWVDKEKVTLFLPQRSGLVLTSYEHKMCCVPVVVAERPGISDTPRGQFDDVIWVQVARAIMSILALEAAHTAVQAPIALPDDIDEFPLGPNALLQSANARDIHKLNLELPPTIFAEGQNLDKELRDGSRYPDARSGNSNASVITGKGVEALLGTFDTQIKGAQMIFKQAFEEVTAICFEMDEAWWPNDSKTVSGTLSGRSYEIEYTPKNDINGRYSCTVTYGFAAGMHPSQSVITMLQLQGAGLVAKSTVQMNMPFDMDPVQETRAIDVERYREGVEQGVLALVQAAGPMAMQGQDPTHILKMAADIVKLIQDGQTPEDAVVAAFTTMQQAQQAAQQAQMQQAQAAQQAAGGAGGDQGGAGGGGFPPPGTQDSGLGDHVSPGQAGMPPGGMPTVENLMAGFRGNASLPINQATIQRRVPTGGP